MKLDYKSISTAVKNLQNNSLSHYDKKMVTTNLISNGIINCNERFYMVDKGYVRLNVETGERTLMKNEKFAMRSLQQLMKYTNSNTKNTILALEEKFEPKRWCGIAEEGYTVNICVTPNLPYYKERQLLIKDIKIPCNIGILLDNIVPNKDEQNYFLAWLANAIQLNKNTTAIISQGETQGTGKGLFFEHVIRWAFGCQNTSIVLIEEVMKSFNNKLNNSLFAIINEVAIGKKEKLALEKLKSWVSDETITIEKKGFDGEELTNNTNFWLHTNSPEPLAIENRDRRYSVFLTSTKMLVDIVGHIPSFLELIRDEREDFIDQLLQVAPSELRQVAKPFYTEAKTAIQEASQGVEQEIMTLLKDRDLNGIHNLLEQSEQTARGARETEDRISMRKGKTNLDIMTLIEDEVLTHKVITIQSLHLLHCLITGRIITDRMISKLYNPLSASKNKKIKGRQFKVKTL